MNLHVVFGAGQIGAQLASLLQESGHAVRVVRKRATAVPGVEVRAGDVLDPAFAAEAARGASVVYHCMNPSAYTAAAWTAEFPRMGESIVGAALANDARLVCLDNLYSYGPVEGRRTEATPMAAEGPKGRVRVAWQARLDDAAKRQGLRYVAGRAGDFFGPGTADQSLLSMQAVAGIAAGRAPWLIGDTEAVHAFSYAPDVARGLRALGTAAADVEGRFFHLPIVEVPPAALVRALAAALGVQVEARVVPGWLLSSVTPFVSLLRELRETRYQWDAPFLASDEAFRARFPGVARSLEACVADTVAHLRASAGGAPGRPAGVVPPAPSAQSSAPR